MIDPTIDVVGAVSAVKTHGGRAAGSAHQSHHCGNRWIKDSPCDNHAHLLLGTVRSIADGLNEQPVRYARCGRHYVVVRGPKYAVRARWKENNHGVLSRGIGAQGYARSGSLGGGIRKPS